MFFIFQIRKKYHTYKIHRQKQLLKRHQNLNHNPEYIPPLPKEKTNKCHDCGELYRFKGNLIRHMAIHNSDSQPKKRLAFEIGHQSKVQLVHCQSVPNTFSFESQ